MRVAAVGEPMSDRPPPEGFTPLGLTSGFVKLCGPMYGRRSEGRCDVGFWVEERHCNLYRNCHGGWLATLADVQLALACKSHMEMLDSSAKPPLLATINMSVDYLAPAPLGSWVEGHGEILRLGHRTGFSQMTATADGVLCLRASGTFKL